MAHFVNYYVSNYCTHNPTQPSQHLVNDHLNDIFDRIRKVFSRHDHPALVKAHYKYYDPVVDSDYTENQAWKEVTHGFDQVDVLDWLVNACPQDILHKYLSQLIPPTLLILDDYDIDYKVRGIRLLHQIVTKLDDTQLTRSGVDNVFIATLFKCLTYVSQDRDVPLLQAAYPCLMDLIDKTKTGQQRVELFDKMMVDGILLGLKLGRDTPDHRQVLLLQLSRIYTELGALGVQYLGVTIAALCHALSIPLVQLNKVAVNSLKTVIEICWPRVPRFHGAILKGLATSWQYYYIKEDGSEMRDLLKETFNVYRAACKGTENTDLNALLVHNRPLYSALIN